MPFQIPDSWMWVRLGDIGSAQTGTTPDTSHSEYFGTDIPFIKPADIYRDHIDYTNEGLSNEGIQYSRLISKNSILMVCIGGSIGKCFYTDKEVCCNQQINAITPIIINTEYVFYILNSDYFNKVLTEKATGTATAIINKNSWEQILLPLPPLKEQKRIVEKVKSLDGLIDNMFKLMA